MITKSEKCGIKKKNQKKDQASKTVNSIKWPNSASCLLPHLSTSLDTCKAIKQSNWPERKSYLGFEKEADKF